MSKKKRGRQIDELVDELANDARDRLQAGETIDMEGYLSRLPNERARTSFKEAVNAWMLIRAVAAIDDDHSNSKT